MTISCSLSLKKRPRSENRASQLFYSEATTYISGAIMVVGEASEVVQMLSSDITNLFSPEACESVH